jgi:hypothetical protein
MKYIYAIIILASSSILFGAEWMGIRETASGHSIFFKDSNREVTMLWPNEIIPGEEALLVKCTYIETNEVYYHRYLFSGIIGGSAQISKTGSLAKGNNQTAIESASMAGFTFLERQENNGFILYPSGMKDYAYFSISGNPKHPGTYTVNFFKN